MGVVGSQSFEGDDEDAGLESEVKGKIE